MARGGHPYTHLVFGHEARSLAVLRQVLWVLNIFRTFEKGGEYFIHKLRLNIVCEWCELPLLSLNLERIAQDALTISILTHGTVPVAANGADIELVTG